MTIIQALEQIEQGLHALGVDATLRSCPGFDTPPYILMHGTGDDGEYCAAYVSVDGDGHPYIMVDGYKATLRHAAPGLTN